MSSLPSPDNGTITKGDPGREANDHGAFDLRGGGPHSHATVVLGGCPVYLSGVVGQRKDGTVPAGIVEQTELSFDNLTELTRACGGSLDDAVNVHDGEEFARHAAGIPEVRSRYPKPDFLVSTLVQVSGYADPQFLVEIEAIAVLPED
jgi:2-iminobutanoate/2-iminopropanoate deaminase